MKTEILDQATIARRAAAAERKRKSRAVQKEKAGMIADSRATRYFETYRLVGAGEIEPGIMARNVAEWTECARRFAVAAGMTSEIRGRSLNAYERYVYGGICRLDTRANLYIMPYLSLVTGKFDTKYESYSEKHVNEMREYTDLEEHNAPLAEVQQ